MTHALPVLAAVAILVSCQSKTDETTRTFQPPQESTCGEGEQDNEVSCQLTLWHCGINPVTFQGQTWERPLREQPLIDQTTVPRGWEGEGTMTRIDEDEAAYLDDGGTHVTFRLAGQLPNPPCA